MALADLIDRLRSQPDGTGLSERLCRDCQRDYAETAYALTCSNVLLDSIRLNSMKLRDSRPRVTISRYTFRQNCPNSTDDREASMARRGASEDPKVAALAGGALPQPASRAGDRRGVPGPRSSSTPATRCRSNTRWCAGSGWTATRSPRPPRRSGIPGPPTTRRPPRWTSGTGRAGARQARAARRAQAHRGDLRLGRQAAGRRPEPAAGGSGGARSRPASACACTPARSSERWPATGKRTPKAADLPAHEPRKEDGPPCPCDPHLAPRLLNRAPAWMPARISCRSRSAGWTPATNSCVMPPCTRAPRRSRSASRVLTRKGVTAWHRTLAELIPTTARPAQRPRRGQRPPRPAGCPPR